MPEMGTALSKKSRTACVKDKMLSIFFIVNFKYLYIKKGLESIYSFQLLTHNAFKNMGKN